MNITYNNWSLSLDLNGGRIKELTYMGKKVFGTYQRADGKVGNTHICAPSFDAEGQDTYNLPFHGYARTLTWKNRQQTASSIQIVTTTTNTTHYPAVLELSQEFQLDDSFTHRVSVKHLSGDEVPVNIAIHYYWDTPRGWEKSTLNSKQLAAGIKTNSSMALEEKNRVVFPHAWYELTSNGFHSIALWTSFKTDEKGDKQFSQDFCCIEPAIGWPRYFETQESILKMGETKSASISLGAGERT